MRREGRCKTPASREGRDVRATRKSAQLFSGLGKLFSRPSGGIGPPLPVLSAATYRAQGGGGVAYTPGAPHTLVL